MKTRLSAYWCCQIIGWALYYLGWTIFYFMFTTKSTPDFFSRLLVETCLGIAITHLMRFFIVKGQLLSFRVPLQVVYILIITFLFSLTCAAIDIDLTQLPGWEAENMKQDSFFH